MKDFQKVESFLQSIQFYQKACFVTSSRFDFTSYCFVAK